MGRTGDGGRGERGASWARRRWIGRGLGREGEGRRAQLEEEKTEINRQSLASC